MKLIQGGNTHSPAPRPRLTGPRTAREIGGTVTKVIRGIKVCYYDETVVFVDLRSRNRTSR